MAPAEEDDEVLRLEHLARLRALREADMRAAAAERAAQDARYEAIRESGRRMAAESMWFAQMIDVVRSMHAPYLAPAWAKSTPRLNHTEWFHFCWSVNDVLERV
jgi:hypothetical protein